MRGAIDYTNCKRRGLSLDQQKPLHLLHVHYQRHLVSRRCPRAVSLQCKESDDSLCRQEDAAVLCYARVMSRCAKAGRVSVYTPKSRASRSATCGQYQIPRYLVTCDLARIMIDRLAFRFAASRSPRDETYSSSTCAQLSLILTSLILFALVELPSTFIVQTPLAYSMF